MCYYKYGEYMKYLELFLSTNIFILFILTIYVVFFYIRNDYNNYEKNILEEIFLITIGFLLIFLYYKFNIKLYIFYLTINILLLFNFDKSKLSIIISFIHINFIYFITNNYYVSIIYIIYIIIYYIFKNKKIYNHLFIIITTLFMIFYTYKYLSFNLENIFTIINYIINSYIIIIYLTILKKRIKLYSTLKNIEKDKAFKTSIFKVTHEIKNPLAVIKGYLSIFDSKDSDKCERYKNILNKEVDNALLVLKDFSELNNMKIVKEEINFNDLLIEIKETILPFFNNKRINLYIDSEKDLILFADYNRLKQVFINILKNSSEALDINGIINIKAYKTNNKLIITIKDNGCGMTKEKLDNLFVPFNTSKETGTGLGLCLSKEIIEKHNGSIKYSSVLNKYTLVKIILPIN